MTVQWCGCRSLLPKADLSQPDSGIGSPEWCSWLIHSVLLPCSHHHAQAVRLAAAACVRAAATMLPPPALAVPLLRECMLRMDVLHGALSCEAGIAATAATAATAAVVGASQELAASSGSGSSASKRRRQRRAGKAARSCMAKLVKSGVGVGSGEAATPRQRFLDHPAPHVLTACAPLHQLMCCWVSWEVLAVASACRVAGLTRGWACVPLTTGVACVACMACLLPSQQWLQPARHCTHTPRQLPG